MKKTRNAKLISLCLVLIALLAVSTAYAPYDEGEIFYIDIKNKSDVPAAHF